MADSLVLKPRVSEQTYAHSAKGVYVFDVPKAANKHQITEAVQKTFKVTVTDVRTATIKGKKKRLYKNRKFENGQRSDIKKAYVQVKSGDSIPVFAALEEEQDQKPAKKTKEKK